MPHYTESLYDRASCLFSAVYTAYNCEYVHGAIGTVFSLNRRLNSGGVYAYWIEAEDNERKLLYIGQTHSFYARYYQHNLAKQNKSNKRRRIEHLLLQTDMQRMGVTLIAKHNQDTNQTPYHLVNPEIGDKGAAEELDQLLVIGTMYSERSRKRLEGILLRAYCDRHGALPPWSDERQRTLNLRDELNMEASRLLNQLERKDLPYDYQEHDLIEVALKMEAAIP